MRPAAFRVSLLLAASALLTLSVAMSVCGQTPPPGDGSSIAEAPAKTAEEADPRESMCLLIEAAAREYDLPPDFFARVIWQESRFQSDAVSGENAEGIAQFMPGTAAQLGLLDPFDPVQALPKSAEFLRDLRTRFGNLGLAAAAYNGGPQRVQNWLAHGGSLSGQTRAYVFAVTGRPIEDWTAGKPAQAAGLDCRDLIASSNPNRFVQNLELQIKLIATSPWGVELSAGFSRSRALVTYSRLAKQYADILAGHDPSLLSTTLRSRGMRTFYQVRVGAQTRESANGLCANIQRAGGACMVLRNMTFRGG